MPVSILEEHFDKWTPEPNTGCYIWIGSLSGSGQQRAIIGLPRIRARATRAKTVGIARLIAEEVYGPPPTSKHHAAHSTPRGCVGGACVNPDHIRWATPKENQGDIHPDVMKERLRKANSARLGY